MFSNKRPQPGESEQDILAQEKSFLQALKLQQGGQQSSSFKPAATVIKKAKREDGSNVKEVNKSSGSIQKPHDHTPNMDLADDSSCDEELPESEDPAIPEGPLIFEKIKEHEFDLTKLRAFPGQNPLPKIKVKSHKGKASAADEGSCSATCNPEPKRGKSLFAKSFDAKYGAPGGLKSQKQKIQVTQEEVTVLTGSGSGNEEVKIGDNIHPYLTGMTEQEILEEQKNLMANLDPKLVAFVKSRSKATGQNSRVPMEVDETPTTPHLTSDNPEESDLPIHPKSVENYPGMKNLEIDKLAWTGLIKEERMDAKAVAKGANARFGFNGNLIQTSGPGDATTKKNDSMTFEKGLHHHGDEMDKAGYTLEELLTLARSTKFNQRALALETIGNIYENAHTGMYDLCFEKSLFQLADYMDFIYAIRKTLDESDRTSVNAALRCLGQILYPWEEEICLDIVYLWDEAKPHPWISTKSSNLEMTPEEPGSSEKEMKDTEFLTLDLIEFLVHRSNLLTRISYFLKMDNSILSETGVQGILKILIRVARHSPSYLLAHKDLVRMIIENYASPDWRSAVAGPMLPTLKGVPLPMALKIIRILIDSSQQNASIIYNEFNIFPTVMSYLAYEEWRLENHIYNVELLILESFRIWIAFIAQRFAIDEYAGFFPVLMKFVTSYLSSEKLHPFDMLHSAHLFSLLLAILRMNEDSKGIEAKNRHSHWNLVKDIVSSVEQFVEKVMAYLCSPHLQAEYDQDATIFSLSKALRFLIETSKYRDNNVSRGVTSGAVSLLRSEAYSRVTCELKKYSVILSQPEEGLRYPSNFASVNAIRYGGKWNPIIEFRSALPFLTSLLAFLKLSGRNYDKTVILDLVMNSSLKGYMTELLKSNSQSDKANFFVRFELAFILELVKLLPKNAPERFSLAYKAVSEVPKCCPKLFNRLFKLALESSCDESDKDGAYNIFGGYLMEVEEDHDPFAPDDENSCEAKAPDTIGTSSKKKVTFGEGTKKAAVISNSGKLEFQFWSERCIGCHWILEPLQRMYTIVTSIPAYLKSHVDEIEMQVRVCLQLIRKCLESYCDFIVQTHKDFVTVYCRIGQIFLLGEPGIYIDVKVSPILKDIIRLLTTCKVVRERRNKSIFVKIGNSPLGLPNMISDFYPELLTEYTNNSYFNDVFAQYLMIPLRAPEDAQLKSNFWNLECVNSVRITTEQSVIPIEYLTEGAEKDPQLLTIYMRLVHSGRISKAKNPFLFQVLTTQLKNSVSGMNQGLRGRFEQLKI